MTYHKRYRDAVNSALESLGVTGTYGDLILHALSEADDTHLIRVEGSSYTIKHPISERLTADIFDCPLDAFLADRNMGMPPVGEGTWEAIQPPTVNGGEAGWLFIPEGLKDEDNS